MSRKDKHGLIHKKKIKMWQGGLLGELCKACAGEKQTTVQPRLNVAVIGELLAKI